VQVLNIDSVNYKLSSEKCICNTSQFTQPSLRNIAWQKHCSTRLTEFIELKKYGQHA